MASIDNLSLRFEKATTHEGSIIKEMLRLFRGDTRRVMQQKSSGSYGVLHAGPLTAEDLKRHLQGDISVSIYLLDENSLSSTICFDVDIPKIEIPKSIEERGKKKISEILPIVKNLIAHIKSAYNLSDDAFLLEDTGGRGYHLWIFFEQSQPAHSVIIFAEEVKRNVSIDGIEIFPSSPQNGPSGYSKSNVRLPLGLNRKYPGARSVFLDLTSFAAISLTNTFLHLQNVRFTSPDILKTAKDIFNEQTEALLKQGIHKPTEPIEPITQRDYVGNLGNLAFLCPALSNLVIKARKNGHLKHHERLALALTLRHCNDGEDYLHRIFKYCSDYSKDETQSQINSLIGYRAISCVRLQGIGYNVCNGWCHPQLKEAFTNGNSPTPLWLTRLWKRKEDIETDTSGIIDKIASIDNLYQAWQQARVQARERDIFEDVLSYESFAEFLMPNLNILRAEILSGRYRHGPFRVIEVPKEKNDYENVRPVCVATPWDSIVTLAVLNVIGPLIDSTFHDNALGNRLAHGAKSDGQIFEDWRKLNLYREIYREGFSEYGEAYYYVLTDITRFYEFIRHDILMALLRSRIDDQNVLGIIQSFMEADWLYNNSPRQRKDNKGRFIGIPQGSALSSFLANLYLDQLDNWLEKNTVDFVRYVDDLAILCEGLECATRILTELRAFLKNIGLELSNDSAKTRGPFPATHIIEISDWIRDARYELFKFTRRAETMTPIEKSEMRSALSEISGAHFDKEPDLIRLIKYLGFYIAATERLEQPELQKGVYSLALYVLNEQRPKHNATSIAMRALIKACEEFGEDAWIELKRLLDSRRDEYIQIILAQEARRYLDEEHDRKLYPELQKTLEQQIACTQMASAAAIECLAALKPELSIGTNYLWQRFLGDDAYLRPLAAIFLSKLGLLNGTVAARIIPQSREEAYIYLVAIRFKVTQALIDFFAEKIQQSSLEFYSEPPLLLYSIETGSIKGLRACKAIHSVMTPEIKHHVCHYVAAKYIDSIIAGNCHVDDLPGAIKAAILGGLPILARQLYDLGRYARIITELAEIDHQLENVGPVEGLPAELSKLPTIEEVTLKDPLISINSRIWLHLAVRKDGKLIYHEVVPDTEIISIGHNLPVLIAVLNVLRAKGLLIIGKIEIRQNRGIEYALGATDRDDEYQTIGELISNERLQNINDRVEIIRKAGKLLDKAKQVLSSSNLPLELLPVPCSQNIVIDSDGKLRFRNVIATIAGGKKYIAITGRTWDLPRENWEVYALGLLFFEIVTSQCASSTMRSSPKKRTLSESAECKAYGALFAGIIGKATAKTPDARYENIEFFLKDVEEWRILETALAAATMPPHRKEFLRRFWHIELGLKRRIYELARLHSSFLEAAPPLTEYALAELAEGGELYEEWLSPFISELRVKRPAEILHVASLQMLRLATALENEVNRLMDAVGLRWNFTLFGWIRFTAAACEIEAIRRAYCILCQTNLEPVCKAFYAKVENALGDEGKVKVELPYPKDPENGQTGRSLVITGNNLKVLPERLSKWLKKPVPDPVYPDDFLILAILFLISTEGITLHNGNGDIIHIDGANLFHKRGSFRKTALILLNFYDYDVRWLYCATKEIELFHKATNLAVSLGSMLSQLEVTKRRFAKLHEPAFQSLYTHQLAQLDLSRTFPDLRKPIVASRNSLLPFPKLAPFHGKGCPFSIEIIETIEGTETVALSLPPVVRQGKEGAIFPSLVELLPLTKTQRLWGIARCGLGYHNLHLLWMLGLYFFQVFFRKAGFLPSSDWFSAADGWIPNIGTAVPLYLYCKNCIQRYRKFKEDNPTNQDEVTGGECRTPIRL